MEKTGNTTKTKNTNKSTDNEKGISKTAGKVTHISEMPGKWMKIKLYWLVAPLLVLFAIYIGCNLFKLSVTNSEKYQKIAMDQQLDGFEINANRGTIFDRNSKVLAKSTTVWRIVLSPYDIRTTDKCHLEHTSSCSEECLKEICQGCIGENCKERAKRICRMLSEILELDYDELVEKCENPNNRYEVIAKNVGKEKRDALIKAKSEKGIGLYSVYPVDDTKRTYPNNSLASNIIGFTDYDNNGQYGVEAFYDEYLQGRNGRLTVLKDGAGRTMASEYERHFSAVDGNDLYLTVDTVLQHYLEKNLEIIVSQHNVGNRATGIMMDPNTGAILAMATTPGYDLNNPAKLTEKDELKIELERQRITSEVLGESGGIISAESTEEIEKAVNNEESKLRELQWKNKAITELYYPGSVFKAITAASALEEKVVSTETSFHCEGVRTVLGVQINCWQSWGHGSVNSLAEALTKSCNPSFIDISSRLGDDRFYDYLEAFGITQKTGIDLPAEASPIVMPRNKMSAVDLATSSFGQTNKITPLQMITAFSACVNGGYLVTPHVVDKIADNNGNIIKNNDQNVKRQILSKETSEHMKEMLEQVVTSNGGSNSYISGYRIGGKSGTSQKLDEYPEDDSMRYVASFCAFTPADDPKVIMLVIVDEPNPGGSPYYGSMVAAPVVSAVFKESFQHLEIYPVFTEEEQAAQDTVVPFIIGMSPIDASMRLGAAGLLENFVGNGSNVVKTIPGPGSPIRKGSTVVIYTEEQEALYSEVPDVHGMTVNEAKTVFEEAGLNIRLSGGGVGNENAVAVYMKTQPGTRLSTGSVVDVQFAVNEGHGG